MGNGVRQTENINSHTQNLTKKMLVTQSNIFYFEKKQYDK